MSEQIKTTTVDQLPEATDTKNFWIFGYKSDNPIGKRSVKFAFDKIAALFGVVSEFGQSITAAISQKFFTDELAKKANLKNEAGLSPIYGAVATEVSEENRDKIASIGAILDFITLGQFILVEDDLWTFAVGYENADGDRIVQFGIRYDGWIYPLHDLMGERALTPMSDDIWQLALTYANGQVISGIKKTGEIYKNEI